MAVSDYVIPFTELGMNDVPVVGGKNASLGEMICHLTQAGIKVPAGFATTADAYREFLMQDGLEAKINKALDGLDVDDVNALQETGAQIRAWIHESQFQPELIDAVREHYKKLSPNSDCAVAVRSSATAEDLPDASFAGQQETYLNITGLDNILTAMKDVFASLFNDRAISYRVHHGFDHKDVALSAGIQRMARSDIGTSGVLFSLDTESGFDQVVFITASYGLGEMVVQGAVNPDEFYVYKPSLAANKQAIVRNNIGSKEYKMIYQESQDKFKLGATVQEVPVPLEEQRQFCLSDDDVNELGRLAMIIEKHYQRPMDIEWAKDGETGELFILQARPETVQSRRTRVIERYQLNEKAPVLIEGRSIGQKIGKGVAKVLSSIREMDKVQPGDVLVTDMTDPDWEPVMKRASAIVTNRGGRTCHAAIIARELGIPAIVGCNDATQTIQNLSDVTVSCAEGDTGYVYQGQLDFSINKIELDKMPPIPFKVMMNVANPDRAFDFASLPHAGIGLARIEFIISQAIGIHPNACLDYDILDADTKKLIDERIAGYPDAKSFYIDKLAEGISTLAAAFSPEKVIVRFSDFKSNEYANLIGGSKYEPTEENPMLGFRGASRYIADNFKECFAMECEAIHKVRDTMGLKNVEVMIPFVRTLEEAKGVIDVLAANGLERGKDGLRVIMMCELPSNALLADQFLEYFDGFSIGSNDMTQLTLGLDRDSGLVANSFDERNPAVKALLKMAIAACKKQNKYIGICGQGPSDHPDLALWLMEQGIDSVSLNPDTVLETWLFLAKANKN